MATKTGREIMNVYVRRSVSICSLLIGAFILYIVLVMKYLNGSLLVQFIGVFFCIYGYLAIAFPCFCYSEEEFILYPDFGTHRRSYKIESRESIRIQENRRFMLKLAILCRDGTERKLKISKILLNDQDIKRFINFVGHNRSALEQ